MLEFLDELLLFAELLLEGFVELAGLTVFEGLVELAGLALLEGLVELEGLTLLDGLVLFPLYDDDDLLLDSPLEYVPFLLEYVEELDLPLLSLLYLDEDLPA